MECKETVESDVTLEVGGGRLSVEAVSKAFSFVKLSKYIFFKYFQTFNFWKAFKSCGNLLSFKFKQYKIEKINKQKFLSFEMLKNWRKLLYFGC